MDIKSNILALLAIFCVIASAGVVCAAEDGGFAGSNYQDMNGASGSQYEANQQGLEPGAGLPLENQTGPEPGAGLPLENQTGKMIGNTTGNATGNATGNTTGNATGGAVHNATGNATNATSIHNSLLSTGNPILALLAVSAIAGGYAVIRRNK